MHKEIGREKVSWLVGLACQHWPPLSASCGPLAPPPREVCVERLLSLLLSNPEAASLPSSQLHCHLFLLPWAASLSGPELFQNSRFVTTLRPCPFQPCPSRSPSGPVIIISDNWTQNPCHRNKQLRGWPGAELCSFQAGCPYLLSSCWKRPFVSQKCITFPEVSSCILLHVPCTFR